MQDHASVRGESPELWADVWSLKLALDHAFDPKLEGIYCAPPPPPLQPAA